MVQMVTSFSDKGLLSHDHKMVYADPGRLAKVTAPALFLVGDRDRMCPPEGCRKTWQVRRVQEAACEGTGPGCLSALLQWSQICSTPAVQPTTTVSTDAEQAYAFSVPSVTVLPRLSFQCCPTPNQTDARLQGQAVCVPGTSQRLWRPLW